VNYGKRITPKHVYTYETGKDILDILEQVTKQYGGVGNVHFFGHGWSYQSEQNDTYDGGIPGSNLSNTSGLYGKKPEHAHKDARSLSDLQDLMAKGLVKFREGSYIFMEECHGGSTGTFADRLADITRRQVIAAWGNSAEQKEKTTPTSLTFQSGPENWAERNDGEYNGWMIHFPKELGGSINRHQGIGEFYIVTRP
jgi:hypothetical protein